MLRFFTIFAVIKIYSGNMFNSFIVSIISLVGVIFAYVVVVVVK